MSNFTDVRYWMHVAGQECVALTAPHVPDKDTVKLRISLMKEELKELETALNEGDIIETADGIADLLVVTYGTSVACGVNADTVFTEVMQSNFTKFLPDGSALLRSDGKVLKGPDFRKPNIRKALRFT